MICTSNSIRISSCSLLKIAVLGYPLFSDTPISWLWISYIPFSSLSTDLFSLCLMGKSLCSTTFHDQILLSTITYNYIIVISSCLYIHIYIIYPIIYNILILRCSHLLVISISDISPIPNGIPFIVSRRLRSSPKDLFLLSSVRDMRGLGWNSGGKGRKFGPLKDGNDGKMMKNCNFTRVSGGWIVNWDNQLKNWRSHPDRVCTPSHSQINKKNAVHQTQPLN